MHTTALPSGALPVKTQGEGRNEKTRPSARFRRSVLVKGNYILRTRQIGSDLLSENSSEGRAFSVRIMIT